MASRLTRSWLQGFFGSFRLAAAMIGAIAALVSSFSREGDAKHARR